MVSNNNNDSSVREKQKHQKPKCQLGHMNCFVDIISFVSILHFDSNGNGKNMNDLSVAKSQAEHQIEKH